MIRWTASGAVSFPRAVQIRVQHSYPNRIRAGAPSPERSLTTEELKRNIRHFTEHMNTPRTVPCTRLILSGAALMQRSDLREVLQYAKQMGIVRVILHVPAVDLPRLPSDLLTSNDTVVVAITVAELDKLESNAHQIHAQPFAWIANLQLFEQTVQHLTQFIACICPLRPQRLVMTYPFPPVNERDALPMPARIVDAIQDIVPRLQERQIPLSIKGLPACYLGDLQGNISKTTNRWYVDAAHQCEQALMFFPRVVSFYKGDACRFCTADAYCDGYFQQHLSRPGMPPLQPLS